MENTLHIIIVVVFLALAVLVFKKVVGCIARSIMCIILLVLLAYLYFRYVRV